MPLRTLVWLALAVPGLAHAAVFTAGPSGTHGTIQAAVDAAVAAGGDNEVRVQAALYNEKLLIPGTMTAGSLSLTGGWDAAFALRSDDPTLTTLDAGASGSVLRILVAGGTLSVDGLTLQNGGTSAQRGGGVEVDVGATTQVTITNCHIQQNDATAEGGGLWARLQDASGLTLGHSQLTNNAAAGPGSVAGGGLLIRALHDSTFLVHDTTIARNETMPVASQATGVGVFLLLSENAVGEFSDNFVLENTARGSGPVLGCGGSLATAFASGSLTARRNQWLSNLNEASDFCVQVDLLSGGTSTLEFTDSIVAGGNFWGVLVFPEDSSTLRFTNNTVTDHPGPGLAEGNSGGLPLGGALSVYNTILFDNTTNLDVFTTDTGGNLVGVDPLFVDAAADDYRLLPASPAIDAGDGTPPGGLGAFDVLGSPRVFGTTVDIGAVEFVPEPAAGLLAGAAWLAVAALARRRRAQR